MATIANYFEQAQLSLAAYALNLTPGIVGTAYTIKLETAGMSQKQAELFSFLSLRCGALTGEYLRKAA